eukprot:scaffold2936_cov113-Cylindrotheca_fusiformis.AAC.12
MVAPGPQNPRCESPSFPKNNNEEIDYSCCPAAGGGGVKSRKRIILPISQTKKSVRFAEDPSIVEIPPLSEEDISAMFYTKQEKNIMKWHVKSTITQLRNHRLSREEEEDAQIGLESHVYPNAKVQARKRMLRLVMNHKRYSSVFQKTSSEFMDANFLADDCRTVSLPYAKMAQDRALRIYRETTICQEQYLLAAPVNLIMVR